MRKRQNNIFAGVDWVLVLFFIVLVFLGWINIYAASVTDTSQSVFDSTTLYGKQLRWIGLSGVLIVIIISIDAKFYERFAGVFYVISMLSLAGLFLFGNTINGATSWYNFGGVSLQPSEFAKVATILALANFLNEPNRDLSNFKTQIRAFLILSIPAVLIALQPDPGSGIIYFTLFFVMYREGLPGIYLGIGFMLMILFLSTLYFGFITALIIIIALLTLMILYLININKFQLNREWPKVIVLFLIVGLFMFSVDYIFNNVFGQRHRDRFSIVLGKEVDPRGIGYNTNQSMITIGSGGLTGKGFLEGDRTQGNFVPEQHTDYIFSTVGEEWGFIGTSAVIIIFIAFILRIIRVAERQKLKFSRVFGYSIATIFFFHFMINVGMVIGLVPTIGIPLPFFSYGGSSLWGFTILLFIFIRLDADRTYEW
ncbi:rod shape-determining protein RodA [Aureibaculum sp. A20]|uniref:Cell wall polymerase n=1 Tax=Aureibaculum flavum TaxID=2795986 RepID=A0ABS0WN05_9FLAO|nr:rod shape-determining protein RodA [Aureibaculum flavum]MBJ2173350.1 rod shape-determining protein RodA [Aureibaculum flavum]